VIYRWLSNYDQYGTQTRRTIPLVIGVLTSVVTTVVLVRGQIGQNVRPNLEVGWAFFLKYYKELRIEPLVIWKSLRSSLRLRHRKLESVPRSSCFEP
jgi:hypothetical protein